MVQKVRGTRGNLVSFEVKGVERVANDLRRIQKEVLKESDIALLKSLSLLNEEIVDSIAGRKSEPRSVDTGEFINSITSKKQGDVGIISSDAKHAKPLEFGTSRMPPRKHFRNSLSRSKNKIEDIFERRIRIALK